MASIRWPAKLLSLPRLRQGRFGGFQHASEVPVRRRACRPGPTNARSTSLAPSPIMLMRASRIMRS